MRDDAFILWLENNHKTGNGPCLTLHQRRDATVRCQRVEAYEGNLDERFAVDGLAALLRALNYTQAEEARNTRPQHTIPMEGSRVKATKVLRHAVNLYRLFCQNQPPATG